jgi:exodeoxyribonuclease VII large subunit
LLADLAQKTSRLTGALAHLATHARARLDRAAHRLPNLPGLLAVARQRLDDRAERLALALPNYTAACRAALERLSGRLIHPREFLLHQRNRLALLQHRLNAPLPARLREARLRLENLASRLPAGLAATARQSHARLVQTERQLLALPGLTAARRGALERIAGRLIHPRETLLRQRNQVAMLSHRLEAPPSRKLQDARMRLENLGSRLDSVSYEAVLRRGFVLVTSPRGRPIPDAAKVRPGDDMRLNFHDGEVPVRALPQQAALDL